MSVRGQNSAQPKERLLLAGAILVSVGLIFIATGDGVATLAFAGGLLVLALLVFVATRGAARPEGQAGLTPDWSVTAAAIGQTNVAIAITDRANRLVCANESFTAAFGASSAPPRIPMDGRQGEELVRVARAAWRDGECEAVTVENGQASWTVHAWRTGRGDDYLIWHFVPVEPDDSPAEIAKQVTGGLARQLSRGGIELALVGPDGAIRGASAGLARRAAGDESASMVGQDFAGLFHSDSRDRIYFAREGGKGSPQVLLEIPFAESGDGGVSPEGTPALMILLDGGTGLSTGQVSQLEALLQQMPLGLALTDRDGHFLFANPAFRHLAGIGIDERLPPYAADLVVPPNKASVSDLVRRCGQEPGTSGQVTVRPKREPDVSALLSVAGIRGAGRPAVLLSLSAEGGHAIPSNGKDSQIAARPATREEVQPERVPALATSGETAAEVNILLVQADEMVRAATEQALLRQGYSVTASGDGEEGLALLRSGRFDLFLGDTGNPGTDGLVLAREVREVQPDLPVLLMSDYAEEQSRRTNGLEGVDFIAKPFSVQEIAARVNAALGAD